MPAPETSTIATRYTVSVLPEGHPDRWLWSATVVLTKSGGWAVHDADSAFDVNGQRVPFEDAPRHPELEAALLVARQVAPNVTLNGHPVSAASAA
ncbi:hypothetical protein [Streptomyces zhihengii]